MTPTEIIKKLARLDGSEDLECIILKKDEKKTIVVAEVTQETAKEMRNFLKMFGNPDAYPKGQMGSPGGSHKKVDDAIDVESEEVDDATE